MADHSWNEHLSLGKLHLFPHPPLMLVPGIRSLNRIGIRPHLQDNIHDISERDVVFVRTMIAAPAGVKAYLFRRNVSQGMVERVDAKFGILSILRTAHER